MTEIQEQEECTGCVFYRGARSGKHGYCHARPPQFTHIDPDSGYPRFFFPVVSPHAWCGDWEQADAGG